MNSPFKYTMSKAQINMRKIDRGKQVSESQRATVSRHFTRKNAQVLSKDLATINSAYDRTKSIADIKRRSSVASKYHNSNHISKGKRD